MKEICYKQNNLVEVVAKIDFAAPLQSLQGAVLPENIQNAIKSRFKIYEPSKGIMQNIALSNEGVQASTQEFHQWVYHGEQREKSITITQQSILVSYNQYTNFDEFKSDIAEPIKQIIELEKGLEIQRTGLRFINVYSDMIDNFDEINDYFNPMIACSFSHLISGENCSRNFLVTEYLFDDIKLRLQTGIYNPDYPARIKKKDFIIDIDSFIDIPHMATSGINELLDPIHEKIQLIFEQCITDSLRGILNA